jgi:predicted DNA-binding protein (MmcQ/YjbR family)
MFALLGLDKAEFVNLKCDPQRAMELREEYPESIMGAYHMSKKHWNSVRFDGDLSSWLFKDLIDHSYDLVLASLTRKARESIG